MKRRSRPARYVVCVKNDGFAASLELRKLYRILPDRPAEARRLMRVIDESGEDYLYPEDCFVVIEIPVAVARAFSAAT
jgi:Ca2+-binding EF-hand superfamily protein